MEHAVLSYIYKHLRKHSIITSLQHGFRVGYSCEIHLVLTTYDLATTLNNHGRVDALLLDFSKAFYKVSHEKRIHKIHHYEIKGKMLPWLSAFLSFLTNRSQFVSVDGYYSTSVPLPSGVPQGGPYPVLTIHP